MTNFLCDSSELVMLWQTERSPLVYVPAISVNWSTKELEIVVEPESPQDVAWLSTMQKSTAPVIVGYKHHVAICELLRQQVQLQRR